MVSCLGSQAGLQVDKASGVACIRLAHADGSSLQAFRALCAELEDQQVVEACMRAPHTVIKRLSKRVSVSTGSSLSYGRLSCHRTDRLMGMHALAAGPGGPSGGAGPALQHARLGEARRAGTGLGTGSDQREGAARGQ